jgi:hypothetical protein
VLGELEALDSQSWSGVGDVGCRCGATRCTILAREGRIRELTLLGLRMEDRHMKGREIERLNIRSSNRLNGGATRNVALEEVRARNYDRTSKTK